MTMSPEGVAQWRGADLIDSSGQKVGKVEEIYLDQETDQPEWALVRTGLFAGKGTFVPLVGASPEGDHLRVPHTKEQIETAPPIDPEQELSQQEEQALYAHYGMTYSRSESSSGLPEWPAAS
jgi:sporulation protein YlmC with PRC-barrel domain